MQSSSNWYCASMRLMSKASIGAVSFLLGDLQAIANDLKIPSTHTLGYSREVQLIDQSDSQYSALSFSPYIESQWQSVQSLTKDSKLTYQAGFEITGSDEIDTDLFATVTYQRNFGERNAWQYRISGDVDRSLSDGTWSFQRERLALRLQKRHSPEHTTSGRVRFGYRDQNEATFDGFDQTEVLGELTHLWRPNRDRLALSGTIYLEQRHADFDRFSYDEAGLRVLFRMPVADLTEITARGSYYDRDYKDGFSASNPTLREDDRFRVSVEANREFSDTLSGKVWIGWDQNTSTISDRAFEGGTIGISATYDFD